MEQFTAFFIRSDFRGGILNLPSIIILISLNDFIHHFLLLFIVIIIIIIIIIIFHLFYFFLHIHSDGKSLWIIMYKYKQKRRE